MSATHAGRVTDAAASGLPAGQFALVGPSIRGERDRTPARGDLAHIRLAGQCFVPHYAVPLVFRLSTAAILRASRRPDARAIAEIAPGGLFEALDIAGEWAWGQMAQHGDDGFVGYLPTAVLAAA